MKMMQGAFFCLAQQVANAAGAYADNISTKSDPEILKKGTLGLTGYSACQQGLAGPRMADQQDAFGNTSAELLKLLRFAQELDDSRSSSLASSTPATSLKRDLLLLHGEQAGTAFAEAQRLVASGLHLADHHEPQDAQQNEWRKLQMPRPVQPRAVLNVWRTFCDRRAP